jgi:hypothetical protein
VSTLLPFLLNHAFFAIYMAQCLHDILLSIDRKPSTMPVKKKQPEEGHKAAPTYYLHPPLKERRVEQEEEAP